MLQNCRVDEQKGPMRAGYQGASTSLRLKQQYTYSCALKEIAISRFSRFLFINSTKSTLLHDIHYLIMQRILLASIFSNYVDRTYFKLSQKIFIIKVSFSKEKLARIVKIYIGKSGKKKLADQQLVLLINNV